MGINRPTNLNIRDVPGNGSIVGPSTSPSCVESTTTCCSCINVCGACAVAFDATVLGCTNTFCACSCCDAVCGCDCTVCDRTVPSGMWKTSEQYDAKERDAWGDDTGSSGTETLISCTNFGLICKGACNVSTGGYIINVASRIGWIVAPAATEVSRNWYCRVDAVTTAQASAACGDWFIPSPGQLYNPGYTCRTYWDSYSSARYWSSTSHNAFNAWIVDFTNGNLFPNTNKTTSLCVRAFRCVSY